MYTFMRMSESQATAVLPKRRQTEIVYMAKCVLKGGKSSAENLSSGSFWPRSGQRSLSYSMIDMLSGTAREIKCKYRKKLGLRKANFGHFAVMGWILYPILLLIAVTVHGDIYISLDDQQLELPCAQEWYDGYWLDVCVRNMFWTLPGRLTT